MTTYPGPPHLSAKGQPGGVASVPLTGQMVAGVHVANVTAMTQAAITGGEPPTEAEFNALRTDLVNTRATLAALITSLRNGEIIASS